MDDDEAKKILVQGPRPVDAEDRRATLKPIISRLDGAFGDSIVAIGLYGSTARGADREYSDTEIFAC
jgi:hypothetical protein